MALHPRDRLATYKNQRLALTDTQYRLLASLAEAKTPLSSRELADLMTVEPKTVRVTATILRNRAAASGFPLRLFFRAGAYFLDVETRIARTEPIPLDPDSFRLVMRLIKLCPDTELAAEARDHFVGKPYT